MNHCQIFGLYCLGYSHSEVFRFRGEAAVNRIRGPVNYGTYKAPRSKPVDELCSLSVGVVTVKRKSPPCGGRSPVKSKTPRPSDEAVFQWLLKFAKAGERAPNRHVCARFHSGCSEIITKLARAGRIRVELGPMNWRVIEIEGQRTKEFPGDAKPYRIIDQHGDTWLYDGRRGA